MSERLKVMTKLVDFLLARIAEDEATARAAERRIIHMDESFGDYDNDPLTWRDWTQPITTNLTTGPVRDHIARWDPARVLAECAAKRRIIRDLAPPDPHAPSEGCENCNVLYALAQPYADHPDYREGWQV